MFRHIRPVVAARRSAPRPLIMMHGEVDESVPPSDARHLAEAHGSAEPRLIQGLGTAYAMTHAPSPSCSAGSPESAASA